MNAQQKRVSAKQFFLCAHVGHKYMDSTNFRKNEKYSSNPSESSLIHAVHNKNYSLSNAIMADDCQLHPE